MTSWIPTVWHPTARQAAELGACAGCGRAFGRGEFVVTSVVEDRHLGCASPGFMATTGCPLCLARHAAPYTGECLL